MTSKISNFKDYQIKAIQTALPKAKTMQYLLPGLQGEVGELSSLYAKAIRDGYENWYDYSNSITKELGDCLWFITMIAHMYNIDLDTIANANIDKLTDRKNRGVLGGSGDNR